MGFLSKTTIFIENDLGMNKGLTHLVERLTKTEKRYVRLSFDPVKQANLLKIYDDLTQGVRISAPAAAQSRLLDHIVGELAVYNRATEIDSKLYRLINKVKVLRNKDMHALAAKYLGKAKELAIKHEKHLILLQLLELEIISFKDEGAQLSSSQESLRAIRNLEMELLQKQQMITRSRYHAIDFLLISRNRVGQMSEDMQREYEVAIESLDKDYKADHGNEALINIHNLKGMYAFNLGNFSDSFTHFHNTVQTIEKAKAGVKAFPKEYFFALNNMLIASILVEDYPSFQTHLKKIREVFGSQRHFQKELFSTTLMYEIGVNTDLGYFDRVTEKEDEILEGIKRFDVNIINRQIFFFNLCTAFFGSGDFQKANRYAVETLLETSSKRVNTNSNVFFYANFVQLLIMLQKGDYDFLGYSLKTCIKQNSKIRELNDFDKRLSSFLKSMVKTPEAKRSHIRDLRGDTVFLSSPQADFANTFFDFRTWAEAYETDSTMQTIKHRDRKIELEIL